jgi:hypothetical protein
MEPITRPGDVTPLHKPRSTRNGPTTHATSRVWAVAPDLATFCAAPARFALYCTDCGLQSRQFQRNFIPETAEPLAAQALAGRTPAMWRESDRSIAITRAQHLAWPVCGAALSRYEFFVTFLSTSQMRRNSSTHCIDSTSDFQINKLGPVTSLEKLPRCRMDHCTVCALFQN